MSVVLVFQDIARFWFKTLSVPDHGGASLNHAHYGFAHDSGAVGFPACSAPFLSTEYKVTKCCPKPQTPNPKSQTPNPKP